MKILTTLAALLITTVAIAQEKSKPLPSTQVRDINGKKIAFNKAFTPGKVTIVSFWATWCIPCKQEIKAIKGKLEAWQKESDIQYATVSEDDARAAAQVKSYATAQGWNWPVLLDPNNDLKRSLNFSNVPFTIIIDKKGNVAYMHTGYEEGGEDEVYEIAKKLAAE
jgi:cytochrome c biogenesis protein CcmG, thiol:disulfide interchange protein DsbE